MKDYGDNLIPKMTSATSPSGIVTASTQINNEAWKAFDGNDSTGWNTSINVATGWIAYEFTNPIAVNAYTIKAITDNRAPKNFTFEGWNGSSWIVLDTRVNINDYSKVQEFVFKNSTPYKRYRLNVTANNGFATFLGILELTMHKESASKILVIDHEENYMYHNGETWVSLGKSPSLQNLLEFGMDSINSSQIENLDYLYRKDWDVAFWTEGEGYTDGKIFATPYPQLLTAKNSIQLTGIVGANFKWTATGEAKVALSVDEGVTYHALKNGIWIDVTNDMSNAMTANEYTAMTWEQYKLLACESNFLKHQYYISDNSTVDDILITCELMGSNKLANTSDYITSYDQSNKKITITINKSGTFFANALN